MTRIETMMDALMRNQGILMAPMANTEREGSDGMRSQASSMIPLFETLHPTLVQMEQQPNFALEQPTWTQTASTIDNGARGSEAHRVLYLEDRLLPLTFPTNRDCDRYLHSFFTDIHLRCPCINEEEFRMESGKLLETAERGVETMQFPLLALHYIIFACCEVLLESTPPGGSQAPAGWHWCELAQSVLREKSALNSESNYMLIQTSLLQVSFCL